MFVLKYRCSIKKSDHKKDHIPFNYATFGVLVNVLGRVVVRLLHFQVLYLKTKTWDVQEEEVGGLRS